MDTFFTQLRFKLQNLGKSAKSLFKSSHFEKKIKTMQIKFYFKVFKICTKAPIILKLFSRRVSNPSEIKL